MTQQVMENGVLRAMTAQELSDYNALQAAWPEIKATQQAAAALGPLANQYQLTTGAVTQLISASGELARIHGVSLPQAIQITSQALRGNFEVGQQLDIQLLDQYGRINGLGITYQQLAENVGAAKAAQLAAVAVEIDVIRQHDAAAKSTDQLTAATDSLGKAWDILRNKIRENATPIVTQLVGELAGAIGGDQAPGAPPQPGTPQQPGAPGVDQGRVQQEANVLGVAGVGALGVAGLLGAGAVIGGVAKTAAYGFRTLTAPIRGVQRIARAINPPAPPQVITEPTASTPSEPIATTPVPAEAEVPVVPAEASPGPLPSAGGRPIGGVTARDFHWTQTYEEPIVGQSPATPVIEPVVEPVPVVPPTAEAVSKAMV